MRGSPGGGGQAQQPQVFRPEFLNRVDEIIVFHELTEEDINRIAALMLKAVGITIAGQLAAQLCKDAGESALAYAVELAAKAAVLAAAFPLLRQLFDTIGEILRL